MAERGRPSTKNIDPLEVLSDSGEIAPQFNTKKQEEEKEPEYYTFEMVGDFPKDPENGTTRYPGWTMNNQKMVFDPETGKTRMARLLYGVDTIWMDEQEKIPEKYASRNKIQLSFNNGQLKIPSYQKNILTFLRLRSDNEDCKTPAENIMPRYRELNMAKKEELSFQELKKKRQASNLAFEADEEEMMAHAKYLGVVMINSQGEQMIPGAIRKAYVEKAEQNPKLFLDTYKNPKVKMFGLAKSAMEKDKVIFIDGQFIWNNDAKTVFLQVPQSYKDKPADYLAEYMLTKDGIEIRNRLEGMS